MTLSSKLVKSRWLRAVPVSVITAKEIGSANVSTLEEALVKLTPNISSYTNGMGTTMSLNGINEDYILILENGRRLAGEDRYTRINVANIKRIEITERRGHPPCTEAMP